MRPIDNVIMLGEITRKLNFYSFNRKRLTRGAGQLAVLDPLLPADILNMSSIFDVMLAPGDFSR